MDCSSGICFYYHWIVVQMASREMGNSNFWVKKAPAQVHEESVYPLLYEAISISLVGPSKSLAVEAQIHHVTFI